MRRQLVIDGIPDSLRLDGWWLASDSADMTDGINDRGSTKPMVTFAEFPMPLIALLILVALADWLFWEHGAGVSIAVFALVLTVCLLWLRPGGTTRREWLIGTGFEVICNLPVVEQLQPISLMFSVFGITALVGWVSYGRILEWWQALWMMVRLSSIGAVLLPAVIVSEIKGARPASSLKHHLKSLVLPLGVGLVFLLLLTTANPILERFLDQLTRFQFLTPELILRVIFWFMVATLVWPYLNLRPTWLGPVMRAPTVGSVRVPLIANLVTADSVRNSLVLFNTLFLVQSIMDLGILSGGMALPDGMTYARYAHRGAYPLVATALLAGLFAISTHRMIKDSRFLRNLLFLWLGQNLFLVVTAAFRLSLYVEVYSLTYLRVAAFIWMGLVFVGLVLTIFHITRSHNVAWLVRSNLLVLMATLYVCGFVNFAYVIADYNLRHTTDLIRLDSGYICRLGEQVLPLILEREEESGRRFCSRYSASQIKHDPIDNWREWGFRRWRLQVYLERQMQRNAGDAQPHSYR